MKKLLIIATALLLTGCATQFGERISKITEAVSAVANFSVTQGQVDTARTSYDGLVIAPLRRYASLPRCKFNQSFSINNPCHDRKLLKQLRETDKLVETNFNKVQASIDAGDNSGAVSAYNLLIGAIDVAKSLINKTGVNVL
jgi:hypothetical protein